MKPKIQSYWESCKEHARKHPDYSVGTLAAMLSTEVIKEKKDSGYFPATHEVKKINEECLSLIYSAIENNELEASYPECEIIPEVRLSKTNEVISKELKLESAWIVKTEKYIAWAKNKGIGPKLLVEDMLEEDTEEEPEIETIPKKIASEWKTKNERDQLYRTIGALALLLIEKTNGKRFGTRENPIKKGIYEAIVQLLDDMGYKTEGQSKSALNEVLSEALNVAMTEKNDF